MAKSRSQKSTQEESSEYILYRVVEPIQSADKLRKNKRKEWKYGYDEEHDIVVISKTGQIGDVYEIQGLMVALPPVPKDVYARSKKEEEQYWEELEYPKELEKIKSVFEWDEYSDEFKDKWTPYIESQFDRRENGFWFKNNGVDTYITGSHYMYLQWSKIDVGLPDFREANRIFWIFWEACVADERSYGMCYVKIRRSGFSFMASSDAVNVATSNSDSRLGVLSKTGADAKKMFTDKVVPMSMNYPFFFKPIQAGEARPKTEIAYRVPSERLTMKKLKNKEYSSEMKDLEGLNTTIDHKSTDDNSYDGEKLLRLYHDESGKWERPNNILNNWRVTKTCLRLGSRIVGKCMMGSTVNPLEKGGQNFKDIYYDSNVNKRNSNNQTTSGLYALFIPMEWNYEGYIDKYGMPVIETPRKPIDGIDGGKIKIGVLEYWQNEVDGYKDNPDSLNEHFRQFPRTEEHAFRDEAKSSLFNLNKIYEQIDFNGDMRYSNIVTRGNFAWENGMKDTKVVFMPNKNGRFQVAWTPPYEMQNRVIVRNGVRFPANEELGAFGCDPYDISGAIGGGSKGSLHGRLGNMPIDDFPPNSFFLRYNARPQTAEIFFEDVLMALVFYGMPILAEINKSRLSYHLKRRGYRGFAMNNPFKLQNKLSPVEREIGGLNNNSEDIIQSHASAIETEIDNYIGLKEDGSYGFMPFNETLNDWARFDLRNRGRHDDSISSGLAIIACNKIKYKPIVQRERKPIDLGIRRYSQEGTHSKMI